MVYIVNDGRKIASGRCGNDNVLSAGIDMSLCFCFGGVESGTFQNYVYSDLSPRKLCSVSFCINLDFFSINSDGIFAERYLVCQSVSALC